MTVLEEEQIVLDKVKERMGGSSDREKIKQIYGQARLWNRFHYSIAHVCTYERYLELGEQFKEYKKNAIQALKCSSIANAY